MRVFLACIHECQAFICTFVRKFIYMFILSNVSTFVEFFFFFFVIHYAIFKILFLANLNRGKFHCHLRDIFAPLVIRYIDLMESSIAQSLHKGFQKENWSPVR